MSVFTKILNTVEEVGKEVETEIVSVGQKVESMAKAVIVKAEDKLGMSDTTDANSDNQPAGDPRAIFSAARDAALNSNALVNQLKQDLSTANQTVVAISAKLQKALADSRDLHQAAINAAQAAQAAAEAEVEKIKASVAAHTADMNTQNSQIANKS